MARPTTGRVVETQTRRGTSFALRFTALGRRQYVTLGSTADGWTAERAADELAYVIAQVERGDWQPAGGAPASAQPESTLPTFHVFASEWWAAKRRELRPRTVLAYEHLLTLHLLPWFQHHRLDDITVQEVDRYRAHKLAEGAIGATTINKSVTLLGQILEQAIDYELIGRNTARGRNRRYRVQRPPRAYLDRAEHIAAVLQAAGELDQAAAGNRRHVGRRAFIAALVFGGLRIEEACGLRWRDVDLANGRMRVGEAKTEAGVRDVDLVPALADEFATWKARAPRARPTDFVFATATGRRPSRDNLRDRVFGAATKRAAEALDEAKVDVPLPEGLTPHGMRHTCCSLLFAIGRDPRYVMGFLGHADPAFTLRVYAHEMRRSPDELAALRALVAAGGPPALDAWAGSSASRSERLS